MAASLAPMNALDPTRQGISPATILRVSRERLRSLARRALWRLAPAYARRRSERAGASLRLARVEAELEKLGERHEEQIERLEDLARELILAAETLRRSIGDVDAVTTRTSEALGQMREELGAVPYVAGSPFKTLAAPVGEALGYTSATSLRGGESGYLDFEELFRGPAERVAELQRPYLPLVRDHQPVLDLGCGRGEFLGLLATEGIDGAGVDSDAGMVERCRALGLRVTRADANEHLRTLPEHSQGTIFSAQLIEHLAYPQLELMLGLAQRVLVPGGLFIAETVNPHRVASMKTFWVDPTHHHPVFPETALVLSAIAGFASAYVFAPGFDSYERARLSAPAYSLVAVAGEAPAG